MGQISVWYVEHIITKTRRTKSRVDVIEHIGQELHDIEQEQAGFHLSDLTVHEKSEFVTYQVVSC